MTAHFEAKKHAYRQTQDGIVVSFVVHPNDMTAELATASLGTRYIVAFSEIGEDGKPIAPPKPAAAKAPADHKDRKPFNTLPLSQQAALRCNDPRFEDFLAFVYPQLKASDAAAQVRMLCNVGSRSQLDKDETAAHTWKLLDQRFHSWLTDQQYAESAR